MSDLANKLKIGTQYAHSAAEHTEFMKRFVKGIIGKETLGQLLGNLYYVYNQLESELQHHQDHNSVGQIYFAELNRTPKLAQDLTFHYGENWQASFQPTPAARAYMAQIQSVSQSAPELLIAHAYTRYMGDLSGGQMLQRIAQTALGLESHEGITFYDFDDIQDVNQFKIKYRDALDSLPIDDVMADRIVAEANTAFSLNISMMRELEKTFATV